MATFRKRGSKWDYRIVDSNKNLIASKGGFKTKKEAKNCLYYLKTDFCNVLVGLLANSPFASRRVYAFVPELNFATGEIIDKPGVKLDFSKPETLDDQLAKIYGLTDEDRELITSSIRPWKDKTSLTADRGK